MNAAARSPKAAELESLLPASPDAWPHSLDLVRGLVLVVRLDERAYRAASFLDDRILGPATHGAWLPAAAVLAAAARVADRAPLAFIFHAGHVGSTLLSRLLDETGAVLSLREPLALRQLADAHDALGAPESLLSAEGYDALQAALLALWRRRYAATRAVVVKATSSAGRLAPRLLAAAPQARAVYLNLRAEPYLATLLGGANSAIDLRGHGPGRMRRLAARGLPLPAPLHALSPGELAALGWLAESLSQKDALAAAGERVLALDFDAFLADLSASLARVLAHLGLSCDAQSIARLAASPVLDRYSKAPELPFGQAERLAALAQSRRENRDEIARGLAWLERVARGHAGTAALLGEAAA